MRVLIDECVNPRLAVRVNELLAGFGTVTTVRDLGWAGLKDHLLIRNAASVCDVFLTMDRGFAHQHDLRTLSFWIVVVEAGNNQMAAYEALLEDLVVAIRTATPASLTAVRSEVRRERRHPQKFADPAGPSLSTLGCCPP